MMKWSGENSFAPISELRIEFRKHKVNSKYCEKGIDRDYNQRKPGVFVDLFEHNCMHEERNDWHQKCHACSENFSNSFVDFGNVEQNLPIGEHDASNTGPIPLLVIGDGIVHLPETNMPDAHLGYANGGHVCETVHRKKQVETEDSVDAVRHEQL